MINKDRDFFNQPEADEGLIPRRLRRFIAATDTPLLCGGVVHVGARLTIFRTVTLTPVYAHSAAFEKA